MSPGFFSLQSPGCSSCPSHPPTPSVSPCFSLSLSASSWCDSPNICLSLVVVSLPFFPWLTVLLVHLVFLFLDCLDPLSSFGWGDCLWMFTQTILEVFPLPSLVFLSDWVCRSIKPRIFSLQLIMWHTKGWTGHTYLSSDPSCSLSALFDTTFPASLSLAF